MTTICNRRALVSALLLALAAAPAPLLAQDAAEAAPDANESTEMEAVTVTAQSRSQEVQDVPIAVSVVTEKQVENLVATDLSEVARYVPGLSVDAFDKTQPGFSIRGISTEGFSMGIDRAVGVYVNGVYQTNGGGSLLALNDVQRIEVLKGPQGTLFGRNTAAGAISIITNTPTNDFEATARGRIGNDGQRYFDGLLNMPLGETFGVRVSALTNRSDGWAEDAGTGRQYALDRQEGARIAIGGMLSDTWEMQLSFDHERLKEPQRLQIGVLPFLSNTTQRAPFPPNPASYQDPRDVPIYQDVVGGRQTKGYDGGTLQFIGSLDWATFTSTTAFSESDLAHFEDQDGTNDPTVRLDSGVTQSGRTLYQEFKFAGANDRIDWVAGASYYREEGEQSNIVNSSTSTIDTLLFNQGIRNPCGGPLACVDFALGSAGFPYRLLGHDYSERVDNEMTSKSMAVFGDVIWHLTDRVNLTAGLRYTRDDKSFAWFNPLRQSPGLDRTLFDINGMGLLSQIPPQLLFVLRNNIVFGNAVGVRVKRDTDSSDTSPRLVLDYHFSDDVMGFVSASKGYKAGGFDGVQIDSEYAPEEVRNYEMGVKASFPELKMMLNASLFQYDYSDRQSLQLVPVTTPGGIPQYLVQSTDQSANGVDVEWMWRATRNLTLNLAGAYIDSEFEDGAATGSGVDLSGQPTGEPKWSFAAGANYAWELPSQGSMELNLQHAYRSEVRCNADSQFQGSCGNYGDFQVGPSQNITNLRLGWTSPDHRYGAALYANNLFDKQYVRSIGGQGVSVLGTPVGTITPPRQWGLEFSARF